MATPFFRIQTFNTTVFSANTGGFRVNTLDSTGAAVDVSSGFTIEAAQIRMGSGGNPNYGQLQGLDILSQLSFAFDATGFDVSWTAAQASAIVGSVPGLSNQLALSISDDAGTTEQLVAVGTMAVSTLGVTP